MPTNDTAASRADGVPTTLEEAERRLADIGSADASALWDAYADWLATLEPEARRGSDQAEVLQQRRAELRADALGEAREHGYLDDPTQRLAQAVERDAANLRVTRWNVSAAVGEAVRDVTLAYLIREDIGQERFGELIGPWLTATERGTADRSFDALGAAALATGVLALVFFTSDAIPVAIALGIVALGVLLIRARARRWPPPTDIVGDHALNGPALLADDEAPTGPHQP